MNRLCFPLVSLLSLLLLSVLMGCHGQTKLGQNAVATASSTGPGPAYYGTFYGPLTSSGTNGGYITLLPPTNNGLPGGITNYNGYYSTNRVYSAGYERYLNTWAGPTNILDLNLGAQTYTALGSCSITGLTNSTTNSQLNAMLLITNAAPGNITVYGPPGVVELSGQTQLILTNQSVGAFSFSSYGNFSIATYSGGRSNYSPASAMGFGITNTQDPTIVPLVAFEGAQNYATNSGVPTWTNFGSYGLTANATNRGAASTWPTMLAMPNGSNSLSCPDNNRLLNCYAITSTVPTYVFWFGSLTNVGSARYIYGGPDGSNQRNMGLNGVNLFMNQGSSVTTAASVVTNTFIMAECDYLGTASSAGYTNNIQGGTGNAGSWNMNGLVLFATSGSFGLPNQTYAFGVYTNMTSAARSNILYFSKTARGL